MERNERTILNKIKFCLITERKKKKTTVLSDSRRARRREGKEIERKGAEGKFK